MIFFVEAAYSVRKLSSSGLIDVSKRYIVSLQASYWIPVIITRYYKPCHNNIISL